jgi:UDP-N-acetylglucosamine 2-epimerase (non-hydrolysing)
LTDLLYVVGARPNFMKAAPVYQASAAFPGLRQVVVHTGQHYDKEMSQIFLEELGLPTPDYELGVGPGNHGTQTGRALERLESVLESEQPGVVVVVGDVNSTLAGALAAAKLGIPVAHVEAGLRSFDRTMPEEINRILVDQMSDWCFTHSPESKEHLIREGIPDVRIHFVGNTMIDSLLRLRPRIEASRAHERHGLRAGEYVLVTLHRPKLVDGPLLEPALGALNEVARELPVVFPVHPRTRARISKLSTGPGVRLIDPVGYIDFLGLQAQSAAVVTDSGGVQEETTFLRVPCFTVRDRTERPVTVVRGTNRLLGLDVDRIRKVPTLLAETSIPITLPVGWDGRAAERIVQLLVPAVQEGSATSLAVSAAG